MGQELPVSLPSGDHRDYRGTARMRTPCGQSGSFLGLKLSIEVALSLPGERRDGVQSRPPALITLARALRRGASQSHSGPRQRTLGQANTSGMMTQAIGRPYINRTIITQGKSNQIA